MSSIMQEAGAKIKRVAELLGESKENTIALIAIRYADDFLNDVEIMVQERNIIQEGKHL